MPRVLRQQALFSPDHDELSGGANVYEHEGFNFLPRRPTVTTWTLRESKAVPSARRKLHLDSMKGLIGSSLRHHASVPSVHELRQSLIDLGVSLAAVQLTDADYDDEGRPTKEEDTSLNRVNFDQFAVLWCRALLR